MSLGPRPNVFLLEPRDPFADGGLDLSLGTHADSSRQFPVRVAAAEDCLYRAPLEKIRVKVVGRLA